MGEPELQITIDKKQLRELNMWFQIFPREMSRELKKEWKKELKPLTMAIRNISYSGGGRHSIGRGPGVRTDRGFVGVKRRHTKMDLKHNAKFNWKKDKGFGGWGRIGFSGRRKKSAQHIGFFHERGTKYVKASQPLATGWKIVRGAADMERASGKAIATVLKKKGVR